MPQAGLSYGPYLDFLFGLFGHKNVRSKRKKLSLGEATNGG
jgi:hypothetical protein